MPGHDRTRPTTDRGRGAQFSALVSGLGTTDALPDEQLARFAFLGLFAGSGAVGLEAASRGAAPVLLVEADAATARVAQRNAASTGLNATVRTGRVEQVLSAPGADRFDLVYVDPPYDVPDETVTGVLARLTHGWLVPDALVVVVWLSCTPGLSWPDLLAERWSRRYGETTLHFAAARPDSEEHR